ncbi:MAG: hypothetical protein ACYTDT_03525 [Planctomycetota bacterium]
MRVWMTVGLFVLAGLFVQGLMAQVIVVTGSLTAFTTTGIGVPSAEQSYQVSGTALTGDIVVTPPTGFEISLTTGTGFGTTAINLTPTTGTVPNTDIFVRYNPPAAGPHSGNITHTSAGATQQDQAVSGTIPTIVITGSLTAFSTTGIGVPSAEQSYQVSGTDLTADIVVTPPTGFEISLTTGTGFATTAINLLDRTAATLPRRAPAQPSKTRRFRERFRRLLLPDHSRHLQPPASVSQALSKAIRSAALI